MTSFISSKGFLVLIFTSAFLFSVISGTLTILLSNLSSSLEVKAVAGLVSSTAESSSFDEVGISAFSSSLFSISLPSLSSRPFNSGLSLVSSFKSRDFVLYLIANKGLGLFS